MCLIVDANLASAVFSGSPESDFAPILDWLNERDGCLVYGGHLATELARVEKPRRYLLALLRAGRARQVPDEQVAEEQAAVSATGLCRSNDPHVIALALVSGARTLCTRDRDLQRDFRNHHLVSKPRGSIYLRQDQARLLRHTTTCGRLLRRRKE